MPEPPPPKPQPIHYDAGHGFAVCNFLRDANLTRRPPLVTCRRCKLSQSWKEMME